MKYVIPYADAYFFLIILAQCQSLALQLLQINIPNLAIPLQIRYDRRGEVVRKFCAEFSISA